MVIERRLFTLCLLMVWFDVSDENYTNSVLMVCYSNECRSPIAATVFNIVAESRGLDSQWYADSAGIAVKPPHAMDNQSLLVMQVKYGIQLSNLTKVLNDTDFDKFDYMLGMDEYSVEYLESVKYALSHHRPPKGNKTKIALFTSYDPTIRAYKAKKGCSRAEYWYHVSNVSCNAFLDQLA